MSVASTTQQRYQEWYTRVQHLLEAGDFKASFADGYPYATADDTPRAAFDTPLDRATIGLVSTAGLYMTGDQAPIDAENPEGDTSYRAFPSGTPRERLAIAHTHFDHTAAEQDLNVVLPVERLRQLAREGVIGRVGPTVYSISGYATRWHELQDETAPAIADALLRDGVDAALLVPV